MKSRFEEHEGKLFRMLEEPLPLTPDAEMPCLVRLIQDDSPMGRYNRDAAYSDVIGKLFVAQKIKENPFYSNTLHAYEKNSLNQDYCIASIHTLEILGYPVEEGSHWWALYQMMQGKKVSYKGAIINECWALNQDGNVQYYNMEDLAYIGTIWSKLEFGKRKWGTLIWQLYKEPEPEPAKEQFDVGDWVEFIDAGGRKSQGKYLSNTSGNAILVLDITCNMKVVVHTTKIIRKLFPREVIVHIGCLSGTMRYCLSFNNDGAKHDAIKIFNSNGKSIAAIHLEALDTETRELVESLLKAMQGDEK